MTPKEKAQELVNKMLEQTHLKFYNNSNVAKLCALIAVDEILNVLEIPEQNIEREFWYEVKHEINNL